MMLRPSPARHITLDQLQYCLHMAAEPLAFLPVLLHRLSGDIDVVTGSDSVLYQVVQWDHLCASTVHLRKTSDTYNSSWNGLFSRARRKGGQHPPL